MNNYIIQHAKHISFEDASDKNKMGSNLFGRFNIISVPYSFPIIHPFYFLMVRVDHVGGCTWGRNTCTLGSLRCLHLDHSA
uniref:Uncharacterized protein n=1 Tax=Ixodes ricinus TaxID=34613 RepID=A0A0K8REL3_IXORI